MMEEASVRVPATMRLACCWIIQPVSPKNILLTHRIESSAKYLGGNKTFDINIG
jgi:hypothetical protein